VGSKSLFEDQNFASPTIDSHLNQSLSFSMLPWREKQNRPNEKQATTVAENEPMKPAEADTADAPEEAATSPTVPPTTEPLVVGNANVQGTAVLDLALSRCQHNPDQRTAGASDRSNQVGNLLDALGFGEPQWPEAVGLALALDNSDFVIKALLIDAPDAKHLPLPFVPQLIPARHTRLMRPRCFRGHRSVCHCFD